MKVKVKSADGYFRRLATDPAFAREMSERQRSAGRSWLARSQRQSGRRSNSERIALTETRTSEACKSNAICVLMSDSTADPHQTP